MTDLPQNDNVPAEKNREAVRRRAHEHFKEKETRKGAVFKEMETARTLSDEKTARLRASRLARDAAKD